MKIRLITIWCAVLSCTVSAEVYGRTGCLSAPPAGIESAATSVPDSVSSGRPLLLFFSASWCGPCRMVQAYTFRDPEVERLLGWMDVKFLDVDEPSVKEYKRDVGESGGVPELVLFDSRGNRIGALAGYIKDARETAAFLASAFTAEELTRIREEGALRPLRPDELQNAPAHAVSPERIPLGMRLYYSRWSVNFEAGAVFSRIASSDYDRFRTGFYLSGTANYICSRRWETGVGVSFASLGGKPDSGRAKVGYYISLPLDAEYRLARIPVSRDGIGVNVFLSAGLYGAVRVGETIPGEASLKRMDAGVRAKLIFEAGSFRLSAGYVQGLVPCLASGGYNQGFTVGLAVCLGK